MQKLMKHMKTLICYSFECPNCKSTNYIEKTFSPDEELLFGEVNSIECWSCDKIYPFNEDAEEIIDQKGKQYIER